jgi:hypothetical protein
MGETTLQTKKVSHAESHDLGTEPPLYLATTPELQKLDHTRSGFSHLFFRSYAPSRFSSLHVDFHVPKTTSTWPPKNGSYVMSPVSWCGRHDLNR